MGTNGIKELIKTLKSINGSNVSIYITDKLYGDQSLKCAFHLLNDEERLGFVIREQEIYINKNAIKNIGEQDNLFYFADEIRCIKIRKM